MAQLYNELAEQELIKKFRHDNSWLGELSEKPQWVSNDVIKIPKQGAAPLVLINNNIYPINTNLRDDGFITLSLNKYETENTAVTLDELRKLPYEKLSDVQQQHRETLEDKTAEHALYSLATAADSATTPLLVCTGPVNPATGQRRLITQNLIDLWAKLGKMGVPLQGRRINLSVDHAADLMFEDSNRQKSWGQEWLDGTIAVSHAGFKLWCSGYSPKYDLVNGVWQKQAFEAVNGTDGSVVYFLPNAKKATGSVICHAVEASQNTTTRRNEIGFTLWFIAVGIKDEGFGAIVSPTP